MQALLTRFPALARVPRADLGLRPTPVERVEIDGLPVRVKRDDLVSDRYGGNKARTLEFLLAGAPRRVLTFSTRSAHHAYATAVHAGALGIPTDAVIVRKGPAGAVLERLRGAADRVVETGGIASAAWTAMRLWRPGTRIVPPGGMSARGALGYAAAVFELDDVPARLYAPLGSGTTVTGLLAGLWARGAAAEVVGVRVADAFAANPARIRRRARRTLRLLGAQAAGAATLRVVEAPGDYGEVTPEAEAAVAAARAAGLDLEPTYTGKTLAVMLRERAADALFVNTYAGRI